MKPDEVVYLLRRLGLSLEVDGERLIVTPANLIDDDTRWLIRKHRDAIIAELEDAPRWAWLVSFDGYTLETYHHPDATHAEVQSKYPDAVLIEPLPECLWPHDEGGGRQSPEPLILNTVSDLQC
jgi:hypothetical protein